jgi:chromosomal replication initiation ATPase DnaA
METHKIIRKRINEFFGIDIDEPTRIEKYVEARMIYYWLCYYFTNMNLSRIAKTVNKNHATVLHGIKNFPNFMDTDKQFKEKFLAIYDTLKEDVQKKTEQMSLQELTFRYNQLLMENGKLKETIKNLQN